MHNNYAQMKVELDLAKKKIKDYENGKFGGTDTTNNEALYQYAQKLQALELENDALKR